MTNIVNILFSKYYC